MTAPAGTLSLAEQHFRLTLAASASWQAECNVSTPALALQRIHCDGLPKPGNGESHTLGELQGYRPYALVYTAERQGFMKRTDAVSSHFEFQASGSLNLSIIRESPDSAGDEPTADANQSFRNLIGKIIDELCDLAGVAGYLAFHTIKLVEGPYWPEPELIPVQGLWQAADLTIDW